LSTPHHLLVLNSGSSSLKFGVFATNDDHVLLVCRGAVERIGSGEGKIWLKSADDAVQYEEPKSFSSQTTALQFVHAKLSDLGFEAVVAVGHRIVHGGPTLREHQRITPRVLEQLEAASVFAPLHVPVELALIREAQKLLPNVPQFACFDTAFHRTLPEIAARLPLPEKFWNAGVRRYGFHGLSCESILHFLAPDIPPRAIIAHLGNGASITAVANGQSVDTTMGLTPTGGIIMGTRTGDLDPGVLLHILRTNANSVGELEKLFDKESGLLGISGSSSDMRELHQKPDHGSRIAVEMFARAAKKAIAGFVAVLGGLDLLVFTGGIGEHDATVRATICNGFAVFGLRLDEQANQHNLETISDAASSIRVCIFPSEEEAQIARHVHSLLARARNSDASHSH
jgi:acetate kinase